MSPALSGSQEDLLTVAVVANHNLRIKSVLQTARRKQGGILVIP